MMLQNYYAVEKSDVGKQNWANQSDAQKAAHAQRSSERMQARWEDDEWRDYVLPKLMAGRDEFWQNNTFWDYLAKFPLEKRFQIIKAMVERSPSSNEEDHEDRLKRLFSQARSLDEK